MKGVSTVAITVGAGPNTSPDLQHAIEFTGVQNQVRALAAGGGAAPFLLAVFGLAGLASSTRTSFAFPHAQLARRGVLPQSLAMSTDARNASRRRELV